MIDKEKIEFALNELHKLEAYFEAKTNLIKLYLEEEK